ncbi:hypothetical protein CMV_028100 [Castanea mollissima]|uniref:Uncharacterized protein n=1 Tax=Castanea mollissima TaxID=60419 RepID=A0A8J4QI64_9ROSI|nr:hypothetical protein CMV_028100 [Castanea mollissima]
MGYDVVPTEAPSANMPSDESLIFNEKKKKRCRFFFKKSLWVCCSNVELVRGDAHQEKESEKEKKVGFKHKSKMNVFMCCSNMEVETKEEKEQVNNPMKSCMMMCFSSFVVVRSKSTDLGHQTPKK